MKLILTLLFALFPYLHEQRYTVNYHSCEPNHLVVEDGGTPFEIVLFNLRMKDEEGWERTCKLMEQADSLQIEIDASAQISEPLSVYLFVNDELLQKTLIRENHAYTLIHNPEYLYEQELLDMQESKTTMAIVDSTSTSNSARSNGWLFLLFIFCSWVLTILTGLHTLHKQQEKSMESSSDQN